ncbi:MAG: helix-turn-helix domain-containing protein [Clostridiales bacterium]|nr:helix-turn-helix domain-containing protein [Clostridiales bacterium]
MVTTETIDKLCEYFQCQPDEILEFIPNEHEKERLQ